jgi:hypothetical protein
MEVCIFESNELHLKEAGVEKEDPISPLVQLAPVLNLKVFQL